MHEGYMALLVAILKNCTPEKAWMLLDGKNVNRKWTRNDIDQIEEYRAEGMIWQDIADIFGTHSETVHNVYRYWKRKAVINDN